jgi:DNA-binding NtrC family response regulator
MRRLSEALDRLRDSELPVVIEGETGSGKELVARVIHAESRRFAGPFVVIDLATIPAPLVEVELFGARAGAFTDLAGDRAGILEQARGGTVLIEEVAGAPPELQAKILRVISARAARPVGSETDSAIDVRFLFATARDLEAEAGAGRLRQDLLHRMRVVSIRVPPLRERQEDLTGLIDLILREGTGPVPRIEAGAVERLAARPWPGNVRELRNVIARLRLEHPAAIPAAAVSVEEEKEADAASPFPESLLAGRSLEELARLLEREYLRHHLRRTGGDALAVSRLLGVSRKHLYRRLGQLGIPLRSPGRRRGR